MAMTAQKKKALKRLERLAREQGGWAKGSAFRKRFEGTKTERWAQTAAEMAGRDEFAKTKPKGVNQGAMARKDRKSQAKELFNQ